VPMPCEKRTALSGHESFFTHQAGANRNIEQAIGAGAWEVHGTVPVAVGEKPGQSIFEFLRCLVHAHVRSAVYGRVIGRCRQGFNQVALSVST